MVKYSPEEEETILKVWEESKGRPATIARYLDSRSPQSVQSHINTEGFRAKLYAAGCSELT